MFIITPIFEAVSLALRTAFGREEKTTKGTHEKPSRCKKRRGKLAKNRGRTGG